MTSSSYLRTLDALSRMRDQCNGELALPQICVVGDQTSGKSSLLQCLTGVPFPVKSGTCTRAPTVVQCRRKETPLCEIRGRPGAEFEAIELDDVSKAISKAQKALLPDGGPKVSQTEITLRISGPEQVDIQIVDLPGIIHNGDGTDEVKSLINSYIKSPQTLILLVSEAKQDGELTAAIVFAAWHDPACARTLRVLTKFDTFDSEDARVSATSLVKAGCAEPLGPHAVVCRPQGGEKYDEELEREDFEASAGELPGGRTGVEALKERLPDLFTTLIRTNLKGLELSARDRIKQCEAELRKLGEKPLSETGMLRECQRVLNASDEQLTTVITPAFLAFQEAVHATGDKVTAEWLETLMVQDAFQCPFFQGEAIFANAMRKIVDWWREPAKRFKKEAHRALAASMVPIGRDAIGVSKVLRDAIEKKWEHDSEQVMKRLESAFKEALDESAPFGTANHYLYDKYVEQQVMPDDMVENVIKALRPDHFYDDNENETFETSGSAIRALLLGMREKTATQDRQKALHEHVAKRVLCAVRAAWSVEKKTVTDAILKKTRDTMIGARNEWVSTTLLVDEEIRSSAVEDADVGEQRLHNANVIKNMKLVLGELAALADVA